MPARMLGKLTFALLMVALVIAVLLFSSNPTLGSAPPSVGELMAMTAGVLASVLVLTIPRRHLRFLASWLARSWTSGSR